MKRASARPGPRTHKAVSTAHENHRSAEFVYSRSVVLASSVLALLEFGEDVACLLSIPVPPVRLFCKLGSCKWREFPCGGACMPACGGCCMPACGDCCMPACGGCCTFARRGGGSANLAICTDPLPCRPVQSAGGRVRE
eukprot:6189400-Pleurochrysis_carterae.AAC.2